MTESHVENAVAARIAAARWRAAENKRRREELAEARRRGLARRHAQKLRNLHPPTGNVPTGQQEPAADPAQPAASTTEAVPAPQNAKVEQTSTDRRSQ
ncbi:hypothetical protein [Streptomyces sp. NBC_00096]|uniref:hypothetical protein n=1 Tax=Streptomyces sp. NBC_00096 TaxID=2975650 RepID=UPI0032556DF4